MSKATFPIAIDADFLCDLSEMVHRGYVSETVHPIHPSIRLYNYTPKTQYEKNWNHVTANCRGLILDHYHHISSSLFVLARPFAKIFNYSEIFGSSEPHSNGYMEYMRRNHCNGPFEVQEKFDGSLGIVYWIGNIPHVATRGSFTSDQAKHAMEWMRKNPTFVDKLWLHYQHYSRFTPLFEIVYPENRIVVDYGNEDTLVYLGCVNKKTGLTPILDECPFVDKVMPRISTIDAEGNVIHRPLSHGTWDTLEGFLGSFQKINQKPNVGISREGFVIRFLNSSARLKFKFDDYINLHRVLTNTTEWDIWNILYSSTDAFDALTQYNRLIDATPDEFHEWIKITMKQTADQYINILHRAHAEFDAIKSSLPTENATRKDWALAIQKSTYPGLLFMILDEKPGIMIEKKILKMIEPAKTNKMKGVSVQ